MLSWVLVGATMERFRILWLLGVIACIPIGEMSMLGWDGGRVLCVFFLFVFCIYASVLWETLKAYIRGQIISFVSFERKRRGKYWTN